MNILQETNIEYKISVSDTLVLESKNLGGELFNIDHNSVVDYFGASLEMSDSRILVGARYEDNSDNGDGRVGAVYLYGINGDFILRAQASDASEDAYFGWDVCFNDSRAYISARKEDSIASDSGCVYIYDFNGVELNNETKLKSSDAEANDYFGTSIDISDSKLLIGASHEDSVASDAGAVYLYDLDGTNEIKITASDGGADEYFGSHIAISNSNIVVGSDRWNDAAGAVYVYDLNGSEKFKITPTNPQSGSQFGYSVDISETKIVVGAPYLDEGSFTNLGSFYIYDLDGSNEIKINSPLLQSYSRFGEEVKILGDKIVVGSPNAQVRDTNLGVVYIYDLQGNLLSEIQPTKPYMNYFGQKIGLSSSRILVGVMEKSIVFSFDLDSQPIMSEIIKSYKI